MRYQPQIQDCKDSVTWSLYNQSIFCFCRKKQSVSIVPLILCTLGDKKNTSHSVKE